MSASLYLLPEELQCLIFQFLSTHELITVGKTCRAYRCRIDIYLRRALAPEKLLDHWLADDEVMQFREFQYTTGLVISGSAVLAFGGRFDFTPNDLDCYVPLRYGTAFTNLLLEFGFTYTGHDGRDYDSGSESETESDGPDDGTGLQQNPLDRSLPKDPHKTLRLSCIRHSHKYNTAGIWTIMNFQRNVIDHDGQNTLLHVQMMIVSCSIIEVILKYHSSKPMLQEIRFRLMKYAALVMNILTYDSMVFLYPSLTLRQKRYLEIQPFPLVNVTPFVAEQRKQAFQKYTSRGFSRTDTWDIDIVEAFGNMHGELRATQRYIGDEACYTVNLKALKGWKPAVSDANRFPLVRTNSWCMRLNGHRNYMVMANASTVDGYHFCADPESLSRIERYLQGYGTSIKYQFVSLTTSLCGSELNLTTHRRLSSDVIDYTYVDYIRPSEKRKGRIEFLISRKFEQLVNGPEAKNIIAKGLNLPNILSLLYLKDRLEEFLSDRLISLGLRLVEEAAWIVVEIKGQGVENTTLFAGWSIDVLNQRRIKVAPVRT
ncbi:hypothetical protein VNI00_004384 [Paramarasmius palmivorus]|uniref:F-box domain-containing protein n=1 Tax=Paramarasmius palmivorus TaxID=297713 RepID=A0AAW0DL81_9AGAR